MAGLFGIDQIDPAVLPVNIEMRLFWVVVVFFIDLVLIESFTSNI